MSKEYEITNYQSKKPFSSFLSGVSGKLGVPIWSFYVNRGQAISSFGTKDKNGAILEFYPANGAYMYTSKIGFRTFIKIDNVVYEFFGKKNENQKMSVRHSELEISEYNKELQVEIIITYYTLANDSNGGLVRKVRLINHGSKRKIELIDGLTQILPAGIDYGGYKAISNLLQSWMQVNETNDLVFYKLRASTNDTSEISLVEDGNYYFTVSNDAKFKYIYDYKLIFGDDTSFVNPFGFEEKALKDLLNDFQVKVNQVPSAFTAFDLELSDELAFTSLIGYSKDLEELKKSKEYLNFDYLSKKQEENKKIHNDLTDKIDTETNLPLFDDYLKQNLLDNILRGGYPLVFETKDRLVAYHIYSRKHGDLERDYNFFSIEPKFYSQGNGNFRDVLQNRRNDLMFVPEMNDSNIIQFGSLIQADGYNPLSIEGLKFIYVGNKTYNEKIMNVLKNEFTPGDLATILYELKMDVENELKSILKESKTVVKASFGEGYWEDHFTYFDDVIDSYENIYPDKINDLVFNNIEYSFYDSFAYVNPRNKKYVLTNNKIRQYDSVSHSHNKNGDWLKDKNGNIIKVNLIGKLITLIVNKYAHLDPYGIGLSYEANKPGWNDAMNGLPGLFASGISETIELSKLVKRVKRYLDNNNASKILMLALTKELIDELKTIKNENDFEFWDLRMTALENYRLKLEEKNNDLVSVDANLVTELIKYIDLILDSALEKAAKLDKIMPTYLTYEVTKYEELKEKNQKGESFIKPLEFKLHIIPTFLEAPARYIKNVKDINVAKDIYRNVKQSELYDDKLKFYKTSVDLTNESVEIGRIHAFTKGWLERESNFLHMTYKYILALLKAGLYDEYYEEIKTNYTCFMDPSVYGRSPLENSSFIAPSNNPDERKRGQGFVSRLSGSTAEMLSMWQMMFFGGKVFHLVNNELAFQIKPKLSKEFFKNGKVKTRLFSDIDVEIINNDNLNTYDSNAVINKIELISKSEKVSFEGSKVVGNWAIKIRQKSVSKIIVYIKKEEK